MLTFLYNLIIMPLVLIVEFIYTIMSRMIGNVGLAIIAVSVVVSTLILPLYRKADAMQEEEREKQEQMEHWVSHIKRTFKGDEQYMMLTTYYRQMQYHPLYSLRSSVSLLLQIPFFIAAYRYLSGLEALKGISFGPIADLSAPDGLIRIAGLTINLLPVLMTVINLVSGAVYSRGLPLKTKAQQYILTLLFLILLYNRPAGLVLYWTMNNVYSLGKNLITKVSKHPERDTAIAASLLGVVFLILCLPNISNRKSLVLTAGVTIAAQLPLFKLLRKKRAAAPAGTDQAGTETAGAGSVSDERTSSSKAQDYLPRIIFILGGVFLTVLAGYKIPISVISASPAEFLESTAYVTPLRYVIATTTINAGVFLLWANIFYSLSSKKVRKVFTAAFWFLSICGLINYMFFSRSFGVLSTLLTFDEPVKIGRKAALMNLAVLLPVALVLYLVWKKFRPWMSRIYGVALVGLAVLCISDTVKMQTYINRMTGLIPASKVEPVTEYEPIFRLSRTGKNVVVLMMDRMISGYLPYMLHEKPELNEQFSGFTWYPNTISYGRTTNYGSPALFGGYEYVPEAMNKRDTELLAEKQNELLKVMPVMFLNEGYEVTVCDPPLANYMWIPDLTIYDDYPEIKAYNTMQMYNRELNDIFTPQYERLQRRNFVWYAFFRMMPSALQPAAYDEGAYFNDTNNIVVEQKFIDAYGALTHLPDMVEVTDEDQDTFLMIANKTSHDPTILQLPDYTPSLYVDNSQYYDESNYTLDGVTLEMTKTKHFAHYDVNMATMLKVGEWLDCLKENGVYDNTRIIIVADHGHDQGQLESLRHERFDAMMLNPMFLVKDFDADGPIATDNTFMTNGDTPVLATDGLIEDPTNPFTGNPISSDEKTAHPQLVTTSHNWSISSNHGTTYDTRDGIWLSIEDDIFDKDNWKIVKETEIAKEE